MCGNELACRLIKSIRDALEEPRTMMFGDMTRSLFSELDCLAKSLKDELELEVDIRHKPKDRKDKNRNWEFLYDVCLFVTKCKDKKEGYFTPKTSIRKVLLVLECEWNSYDKDRLYDFSKLLLARAELRAFVLYENSDDEKFNSILKDMKSLIKDFEQGKKSDRYLICRITSESCQFQFILLDGEGNDITR